MREENPLSSELQELEDALSRSMKPAATSIDSVAAAYGAGHNAARREVRNWRAATIAMFAIGAAGWLIPARSAAPRPATMTTVVVNDSPRPSATSLVVLQRAIMENGLDDLPEAQLPAASSISAGDRL